MIHLEDQQDFTDSQDGYCKCEEEGMEEKEADPEGMEAFYNTTCFKKFPKNFKVLFAF